MAASTSNASPGWTEEMSRLLRDGLNEDLEREADLARNRPRPEEITKRGRAMDAMTAVLATRQAREDNILMFKEIFDVVMNAINDPRVAGTPEVKDLMCNAVKLISMTLQFAAYGNGSRLPSERLGGFEKLCQRISCPEMFLALDKALAATDEKDLPN